MANQFAKIAFTNSVRTVQQNLGSRSAYSSMDEGDDYNDVLREREITFITGSDSFFMASVSETGWPYVQHRGGPVGFVRTLNEQTIGFADFTGNRQYVSVGNVLKDDRISLFFMDYPNRKRLKLFGHVRVVEPTESKLLKSLQVTGYRARVERGIVIRIVAFDWNCPQHIIPRYTQAQIDERFEKDANS